MNKFKRKYCERIKRLVVFSIFILCITKTIQIWSRTPQKPDTLTSTTELDNYLNKLTTKGRIPGFSLSC